MNSNTYFCSDIHFRHHNVLKFDKERGNRFDTIEKHNDYIANNLLSLSKHDTLYFLGDLVWKMDDTTKQWMHNLLSKVKCELHWIKGNHDYKQIVNEYGKYFKTIRDYAEEKYEGRKFILSHFPLLSWNGMNRENSSIHLHGHDHSHSFYTDGTRYNIAYNGHNLFRHIDGFIDGSHKIAEKYISDNTLPFNNNTNEYS